MQVVVHVDGGARGNPGPAAAAAVVSAPDGRVLDRASVALGRATNNVAEYRALLLGLERAAALGASEVDVVNDSELVAKQVDGSYKVRHADLRPLREQAMAALAGFTRWSIRSVPRAENAEADALVNRALDGEEMAPGPPLDAPPLGAPPPDARPPDAPPLETAAAGTEDYASYLLIDDLLRLQRPRTPAARDELLFIVAHQADELWFKLILHELAAARDELANGRPHAALPRLERVVAVERLLLEQLGVLETVAPDGSPELRDQRAFESRQLRAIEWLSGERGSWPGGGDPPPGPSLYEAFCAGLGLPGEREQRLAALAALYRDHAGDPLRAAWHDVAERLLDHDEGIARWRHRRALAAARLGQQERTVDRRFFDELWDVRPAL